MKPPTTFEEPRLTERLINPTFGLKALGNTLVLPFINTQPEVARFPPELLPLVMHIKPAPAAPLKVAEAALGAPVVRVSVSVTSGVSPPTWVQSVGAEAGTQEA